MILAGALIALSPVLVWYSQEIRMFQPAATAIAWAAYFLLRAWQSHRPIRRLIWWVAMIAAFQAALNKAGVDWEMDIYGGARHGFTNPGADSHGMDNLKYDPVADRRSWSRMQDFFAEIFSD